MRVLVVDDDEDLRSVVTRALRADGHVVTTAADLHAARDAVLLGTDLIVLDLGLPDGDGIELTRRVREWSRVPIIVISARGREEDKVLALDAGADDYLTKPFGVNELLARMRVALRHASLAAAPSAPEVLELGDVRLDLARREVTRGGQEIHLTPIEYKLLVLLAQHAGKVLTHRHILKEVWGPTYVAQSHYVRVHMAELRKKIEPEPSRPRLIVTEAGVGYRLRDKTFDADRGRG